MSEKIRILVIGMGSIGQRHARLLSQRDGIKLAICDSVNKNCEDTLKVLQSPAEAFYDYLAALNTFQPQLVFVATPNRLHVPIGISAIEAGAGVFMEKPIADELADAAKLVALANNKNRFLQIGYMLRFDPGLQMLKSWIDKGSMGQIVGGRCMVGTYITLLNAKSPYRLEQNNSLIVDYTHELDFIRWLFGEVSSVTAAGSKLGSMPLKPNPNIFQMILRMQNNALVQVHMDYIQFPQRRTIEIYGDKGAATYDFTTGEILWFPHQRDYGYEIYNVQPTATRVDDLFIQEHSSCIEANRMNKPPLVSGNDGLMALAIAEAAIKSAEIGEWVNI